MTESPLDPPENDHTLEREIINDKLNDGRKRRVKRKYMRVITHPEDIVYIEDGDHIVMEVPSGNDIQEHVIEDLGGRISVADGMHVLVDDDGEDWTIHMRLIREWLDEDRMYIHGVRTEKFTEVKGVDYE